MINNKLSAFSLLETTLTLALTGILMSIVFSVLNASNNQLEYERRSKKLINDFVQTKYSILKLIYESDSLTWEDGELTFFKGQEIKSLSLEVDELILKKNGENIMRITCPCESMSIRDEIERKFVDINLKLGKENVIISGPLRNNKMYFIEKELKSKYCHGRETGLE